jgi:hypothetical protein
MGDLVDSSILSKTDFWTQEVQGKSIIELLAGASKSLELKVICCEGSILEINQSQTKVVAAEQVPHGLDLPVDPKDYRVVNYYGIPLNVKKEVYKVLRVGKVATQHQEVIPLIYLSGLH